MMEIVNLILNTLRMINQKLESNLCTALILFRKEFRTIEKYKWKPECLIFKSSSRKLLMMSKSRDSKTKTVKLLTNLCKHQVEINGAKYTKSGNLYLGTNLKSKIKSVKFS